MARRGHNIYKRTDGRWEGRYIKGKDMNKKTKYGYVYASSYAEVKDKLDKKKANPIIQIKTEGNIKTMEQVCFLWLEEIKTQIKISTYVKYYNILHNHIIPFIGDHKINSIDTNLIRQFIDFKLTKGKLSGNGGLSPKTVKDILSVIRLVFNFSSNIGIDIKCNFDCIKIKSTGKNVELLNDSDRQKLTTYLINNVDYTNLGILICLFTGIRIGEVCALKFEDISLSDNIVHIRKTMQRLQTPNSTSEKKTEITITTPKSKCSIRDIPLPEFIAKIIIENKLYSEKAYLLTGEINSFVEPRTLENRFRNRIKTCGIENVNFHILRHTFATHCVELGFEIKSLSEILGHSSVNITLNRYVHSSMELKRLNMAMLSPMII